MFKIIKVSYNSLKHRDKCSAMLEIKETQTCACSIETPCFRDNFTQYKKKSLSNLAKTCSIKWVKLLLPFCNKVGKFCRAKFKVGLHFSLYTATFLEDLFENFGFNKFNSVKVLQHKVTYRNFKLYIFATEYWPPNEAFTLIHFLNTNVDSIESLNKLDI